MTRLLHFDAFILVWAAALVLAVGHGWHCWRFRIPLFCLAFSLAGQALLQFGVGRGNILHAWTWVRLVEHLVIVVVAVTYLIERRRRDRRKERAL